MAYFDPLAFISTVVSGRRKLSPRTPFVNVKNFGALGDDSTNDYAAIATAIAAVQAQGGGTLYFPYGKYRHGTAMAIQDYTNRYPFEVLAEEGTQIRPTADIDSFYIKFDHTQDFTLISRGVRISGVTFIPVTTGQGTGVHEEDSFNVDVSNCKFLNLKRGRYLNSVDSWNEGWIDNNNVYDRNTTGIEFATSGLGTGSFQSGRMIGAFIRTASGGTGIKVGASCNLLGSHFESNIWPGGNNGIAIDMQGNGDHTIWHGIVDLAGTTPTPVYALRIGSGASNLTAWRFDMKFVGTYNGGEQESGAVKNASSVAWTHSTLP